MNTFKRGDVALFVTVVMVGIMYFIMLAISQKTVRDIQAGRVVVTSQQAVQVANEGIEDWYYRLANGTLQFDQGISTVTLNRGGVTLEYTVTVINDNSGTSTFEGIRSVGTVTSGNQSVTRTLEAGTNN